MGKTFFLRFGHYFHQLFRKFEILASCDFSVHRRPWNDRHRLAKLFDKLGIIRYLTTSTPGLPGPPISL